MAPRCATCWPGPKRAPRPWPQNGSVQDTCRNRPQGRCPEKVRPDGQNSRVLPGLTNRLFASEKAIYSGQECPFSKETGPRRQGVSKKIAQIGISQHFLSGQWPHLALMAYSY